MKRIEVASEDQAICGSSPLVVAYSHGISFSVFPATPLRQAGTKQIDRAHSDCHGGFDELRSLRICSIGKGL
jgi:hypothetical protein